MKPCERCKGRGVIRLHSEIVSGRADFCCACKAGKELAEKIARIVRCQVSGARLQVRRQGK